MNLHRATQLSLFLFVWPIVSRSIDEIKSGFGHLASGWHFSRFFWLVADHFAKVKKMKLLLFFGIFTWSLSGQAQMRPPALPSTLSTASLGVSSAQGNGYSRKSSISADGRYIAFESSSSNLVSGDTNGLQDIFVRDTQSGTTIRVNMSTAGTEANAKSANPFISATGRYVAFVSLANNLVGSDTNVCGDIFVRDTQSSTTVRASTDSAGNEANGCSDTPSVSSDGRFVAFRSGATNLVTGDTNTKIDFFVKDLQTGTTIRVSTSSAGVEGDAEVGDGMISASGGFVTFVSNATNLVSGDTNSCADIFVRDLSANTTELISKSTGATIGNRASDMPALSADGRYVVFSSRAGNLVPSDSNGYPDIFIRDRTSSTTERVSTNDSGVEGRFDSLNASVTDDGRFVTFESYSPDFVLGDSNLAVDVFLKDRASGLATAISATSAGVIGDKTSRDAKISADGSTLSFVTLASNLVAGDTNENLDVVHRANQLTGQVVNVTPTSGLLESGGQVNGFKFERFGSTASELTVNYTVSGTATPGADYTALSGTIVISSGDSTAYLPVDVLDDSMVELAENIVVSIATSVNYLVGGAHIAINTITDDDVYVISVAATDNVATEDGTNTGVFTITRTGGTLLDLYVNVSASGTAVLGVDYTGIATPVLIPTGQESTTIIITGIPDTLGEGDENIDLSIATGSGYSVGSPAIATMTLKDDDLYTVNVTVVDSIADESEISDKATFRFTRDGATTEALIVKYALRGTASNGVDYNTLSGTVTIPALQSTIDVDVVAISDALSEGVETVQLDILDAEFYRPGNSKTAVVLIVESNALPVVQVVATDNSADENGADNGVFTVSRTGSTASSLVVAFNIGGSASYGVDYLATGYNVTIPSGQSSATVAITGIDDSLVEGQESVVLAISSKSTYVMDQAFSKATVIIFDDEVATLSVRSPVRYAYENGEDGEIVISRKGDITNSLTVNYTVSGTAVSGVDISSLAGSVIIPAGGTEMSIAIQTLADGSVEGPEFVQLTLASGSGYTIGEFSQGRVEIVDKTHSLMHDILNVTPNADIKDVSISDDGRYVVFSSAASNLVANDLNGMSDIFVADVQAQTLSRISGVNGMEPSGGSFEPKISGDGTFVVFSTDATNMIEFDSNGKRDIILLERATGIKKNINHGPSGLATSGDSSQPMVTGNANFVVFASTASDLVSADTNLKSDIFLFSRLTNVVSRVSDSTSHGQFTQDSFRPSVSDDGEIVVFESKEQIQSDVDSKLDVIAIHRTAGTVTRVSKPISGHSNDGDSTNARISGDGKSVAFTSLAKNLSSKDLNNVSDVFSYSFSSNLVVPLSASAGGVFGDMPSRSPSVDRTGRYGVFVSSSRNLSREFNCTNTSMVKEKTSKVVLPIAYQTSLACKAPLNESVISHSGKFVVSTVVSREGIRDIVISSNPLYR